MEELILETNEYQTPLTKSLLQSLPSEIQDQLLDFVYNVPFIQNLISPNRPRAKDLPRDEEGKIIVDLINPHILEDMDYFRESAIHFEKHGCYTFLRPNPNPNSEFGKWLKREVLRCLEGCIRPSDGEWVTGDMYYFLNYSPIKLTEIREGNSKIGDRVKGLPKVWEGIYWRFHYLHQARNGGKYNEFIGGNHCAELAKRGCGKSYTLASLMSKRIVLGESKKVKEEVVTILTAYVKEYLAEKDGTLSKFVPMIDHVGEYTQFPRARYKDAIGDMVWQYGYKDVNTGRIKGSKNIVMGLSVKEEVGKIRGKRGYILIEEYGSFPNLLSVYSTLRPSVEDGDITTGLIYMVGCVCKGTKVIDANGNIKNIEDVDLGDSLTSYLGSSITKEEVTYIQQPSYKECVRIECSNGYYLECSKDHPILKLVKGKNKYTTFELADNLKIGDSLVVPKVAHLLEGEINIELYNNIPFKLNTTNNKGKKLEGKVYNNITTVHVKSIIDIGVQRVYNLTANTTHTYITNGFISSNTSGDKESDFEAAQEIMYHPDGYNVYSLPNVYDKPSTGGQSFCFFFPGYINRSGTFNKDGVSDVIAALISILQARHKIKYNSSDPGAITKAIAEIPITPQEAILRTSFSLFPTQDLIQRLAQIDSDPKSLTDVYSGQLIFNANNDVEFFPTSIPPIRDFPHKDNKIEGCWEIFAMPERDSNGKIPQGRYIASYDPYENDQSETMSLGCVLVLDTWTDTIVAERTGRTALVDNFHEECRKGCLFYNARCLYEAHPYDQVVYTPEGERLWGDIKVGDKLFSPTKGIVTVIDIPVEGEDDIYEITLSDGRKVQSSSNHIWSVYKGTSKSLINITTNDLVKLGTINKYNQHIFYIPEHGGVQFNSSNLPIDPYTMGLILSEGSIRGSHCTKNSIQISSSFGDMEFYRSAIPYTVKHIGNKGYSWNLTIYDCKNIMQEYGLYGTDSHTKFIPKDYLYSNRIQRMELLKGLMDGDGCARTNGASIFITCSRQLAKDIMLLVRSLGIKCWLQTSTKGTFRVAIASENKIFKLPRKVAGQHIYRPQSRGSKANSILNKTAIVDIKYVGKKKCKCVTVSSEDGLYLIGDYVVTHNCNKKGSYAYFSKMNSLYLLADTPEYLKDKQLIKISGIGNSSKGVNATAHINKYARDLITNWLTKPVTKVMHTEEEEKEVTMFNLYNIKARALLKELSMWNMNGNFDRVSSLGMLMLYREHTLILTGGDPSRVSKSKIKTLADDPYFEKNYKKKRLHGN